MRHSSPSFVPTPYLQGVDVPSVRRFLEGCGYSDADIQSAIQSSTDPRRYCYILHTLADTAVAEDYQSALRRLGVSTWRCPIDSLDQSSGVVRPEEIRRPAFGLALFSKALPASTAIDQLMTVIARVPVIAIKLDDSSVPTRIAHDLNRPPLDLSAEPEGHQTHLRTILSALEDLLDSTEAPQ